MVKENEIYKCTICGNHVRIVAAGGGVLTCCGEQMEVVAE